MGLVSLCVEFYRVTPTDCSRDKFENPISSRAASFPYGNATCGLTCSEEDGPFSPMRGGAAGNVNVIPVPRVLTFNAVMLLAAGFCIPAILGLIFTWDKILEINWKRRRPTEELDAQIEGANITVREMKGINNVVRQFLSVIEIPLFGGVIITIIGVGEANFFSQQVRYDTEPMASIGTFLIYVSIRLLTNHVGQWSPIAGTLLAAFGSLYLLWSTGGSVSLIEKPRTQYNNSNSSRRSRSSGRDVSPGRSPAVEHTYTPQLGDNALGISSPSPNEIGLIPTITHPETEYEEPGTDVEEHPDQPTAGRHRVRKWLTAAGNYMGNAAHNKLDVSDYNDQKAHRFPEVPGEGLRNPALERISQQYSQLRDERAGSTYAASVASASGIESSSAPPPMHDSPRPETSPARKPKRRDTLEVPAPAHVHRRSESH